MCTVRNVNEEDMHVQNPVVAIEKVCVCAMKKDVYVHSMPR